MVMITALSISVFQQLQAEKHIYNSEIMHARNLLKMAELHVENQYESYLFHREALLNERKQMLRNVMESAFVELNNIYRQVASGSITESAGKALALDYARRLRYDNSKGYLWVNNTEQPHPLLIMHPIMPHLEGNRMDSEDPLFNSAIDDVKNLFAAFVKACEKNGHGYVNYLWPKPLPSGITESQPKISFVKTFQPWNWIVGTGIYIDDIENDSRQRIDAIIKELRKSFARIKLGDNSYLFVFTGDYEVLVHPVYEGRNLTTVNNPVTEKKLLDEMIQYAKTPDKPLHYRWNKPSEAARELAYDKSAFVTHFAPLNWYIVASIYHNELIEPLISLRWKILIITLLLLSASLLVSKRLSGSLSRPLQLLADAAARVETDGIDALQIPEEGTTETRKLGHCLNSMLSSIRASLSEREQLLNNISAEEENYRTTLNSIADAVISADISGKILEMNPMAASLTGWSSEEAFAKNLKQVYNVISADTRRPLENTVEQILNGIKPGVTDFSRLLVSRNGQEFYIAESGSVIRNSQNETRGIVLVFRNITDEYSNQQKLKDAEWKFNALYEHGPLGVAYHRIIYDASGNPSDYYFIDANSNYRDLTGVDPRGKTAREAFPGIEKDPFNWISTFGKVARTGQTIRFQQQLQANSRWYDCAAFQYKPDHFVAAFFEITEQRKIEQQLRQAHKMDAIGQLAGGIAHDFNNVLSGILGAAELLAMEISNNQNANRYLSLIQESSARASDLIRKLLAFGRQNNLVSTPVDSHKAASEAVALLKCSVDKKVKIETRLEAENSMVIGDISQLQNVFLNLGINSSHAMPEGGSFVIESRNIELDAIAASSYELDPGDYIKFEVRDNGCGIAPENLQKIFEPFFTTKEQGKGTGLGLAAAFGIIKQHRGSISVYSEIGVGTVFHIMLPLTSLVKKATAQISAPVKGHGRILIIDDEQVIRTTASAILKQLGYETITAENGLEGLDLFRQEADRTDLVILDMIMPIMNGRECFEKIRQIKPSQKVILASGFSKEDDLQSMKAMGLSGFIHKPFSVHELSTLLQEVLNKKSPD
jgi:PAS domain S-box-containing protein